MHHCTVACATEEWYPTQKQVIPASSGTLLKQVLMASSQAKSNPFLMQFSLVQLAAVDACSGVRSAARAKKTEHLS